MPHELIHLGSCPPYEEAVRTGSPDYALKVFVDRRGIPHSFDDSGVFAPIHGECRYVAGKRKSTPEYRSWQSMRNRCANPKFKDWHLYGGRGIRVDPKWDSYQVFLHDMGRRPSPKHTLDRIDSTKGYSKDNCRWATPVEQGRNTSKAKLNMDKARTIRNKYRHNRRSAETLAEEFAVSIHCIYSVVQNKVWKEDVVQLPCADKGEHL